MLPHSQFCLTKRRKTSGSRVSNQSRRDVESFDHGMQFFPRQAFGLASIDQVHVFIASRRFNVLNQGSPYHFGKNIR